MRDSTRASLMDRMEGDLAFLMARAKPSAPPTATRAVHKLVEYQSRGFPASTWGGGSRSNDNDPVQRLVLADVGDPFGERKRRLDAALSRAAKALALARREAEAAVLAVPGVDPGDDEKWCGSCWRIRDSQGRPYLSEARSVPVSHPQVPQVPLCAWCYRFVLSEGAWPPLVVLEARRDGKRVTVQMVEKALGKPA